jgi:Sec-independent protein translocase protein TatA
MEAWLLLVIVGVLGFVLGAKTMNLFHTHMIRNILRELGITPKQLKDVEQRLMQDLESQDPELALKLKSAKNDTLPVIKIKLEQHQGTLFAYRADTEEFVGQGVDRDSLATSIAHRFKGVRIEILNGELLQKSPT